MRYLKSFVLAFQFMTVLPLKFTLKLDGHAFARSLCFFPIVGLFVGGAGALALYLLGLSGLPVLAAIVCVLVQYALTGAMHIDGMADVCDAYFARKSPDETRGILKDSRLGVFGVLAIVSCVGLKAALIYETALHTGYSLWAAALTPAVAKISVAVCALSGRYANNSGTGKAFVDFMRPLYAVICCALSLALAFGAFRLAGLIACAVCAAFGFGMAAWSRGKIGGVTGDALGAAGEGAEIICLASLLAARCLI